MDKIINIGIPHIGEGIFHNLSDEDLIKFWHVSKTWKQMAENVLMKRWKDKIIEAALENQDIIKILLMHPGAKDINWNEQCDIGKTTFHYACFLRRLDIVKIMLKKSQTLDINLNMHCFSNVYKI